MNIEPLGELTREQAWLLAAFVKLFDARVEECGYEQAKHEAIETLEARFIQPGQSVAEDYQMHC